MEDVENKVLMSEEAIKGAIAFQFGHMLGVIEKEAPDDYELIKKLSEEGHLQLIANIYQQGFFDGNHFTVDTLEMLEPSEERVEH